jgi:N-acetyl-anhydromuramyl-L-alanine amidase AmpD
MELLQRFTDPSNFHGWLESVKYLIVHTSGRSPHATDENELAYLQRPELAGCYHAYIFTTGEAYHLAPFDRLVWHAGKSQWLEDSDLNRLSVGVAFGNTNLPSSLYSKSQVDSMLGLCYTLCQTYQIPAMNVLGHKEVSPGRKTDPEAFDMNKFRTELEERLTPDSSEWRVKVYGEIHNGDDIVQRISFKDKVIHLRGERR